MTGAGSANAPTLAMPATLAEQGFALREEVEADLPFLRRLYLSTRWEELAITQWTAEQKTAFLESQFALQRHHYRTYYASTEWGVLQQHGEPAGRLYLYREPKHLNVVDVALLPEWRGRGVGTALMQAVCAAARAEGKTVTIAVEKYNPAQTLYRRLGFQETSDEGLYWFMEWRPGPDDQLKTAS